MLALLFSLFDPFWKSSFLLPFISFFGKNRPFWAFLADKVLKSVCSCMRSQFPSARCASARRFFGATSWWSLKLYPVYKMWKKWGFEIYFLFCLSWTHKLKSAYSFLSSGSNRLCFTEKRALVCFNWKGALSQHILTDAKSTKCELKEHLWERPTCTPPPPPPHTHK